MVPPGSEESPYRRPNAWLTWITIDPEQFGASRNNILAALSASNIEARLVWKPLHLQPVFAGCVLFRGGTVAAHVFQRGLCLPSGSSLIPAELERVIDVVRCVPATTSSSNQGCSDFDLGMRRKFE